MSVQRRLRCITTMGTRSRSFTNGTIGSHSYYLKHLKKRTNDARNAYLELGHNLYMRRCHDRSHNPRTPRGARTGTPNGKKDTTYVE